MFFVAKNGENMKERIIISVVLFLLFSKVSVAQTTTQNFTLKPGWNAIYLEVQPEDNKWEELINNIPIVSIWTLNPNSSSVEFVQDPDTLMPEQETWLAYLPGQPEILNNSFTAVGGTPYLVKLGGAETVEWPVTGKPVQPEIEWKANSYNLVGFHLEPGNEPFFTTFFETSPAHQSLDIYRLADNFTWEKVNYPATTQMKHGEAVWIFSSGDSDFTGPLSVELEQGKEMDYRTQLMEQKITLKSSVGFDTTINLLNKDITLVHWVNASNNGSGNAGWKNMETGVTVPTIANEETDVRLGIVRTSISAGSTTGSVLEVKDGQGMRIQIPVLAERTSNTGLWVGSVVVNKVTQPGENSTPTPTPAEFQFRIILHVDDGGNTTLLKEVTQMWDSENSEHVLVANQSQLVNYTGVSLRDGKPVGRRVSSTVFGFSTPQTMMGAFGSSLATIITIAPEHSTNPFLHRYHPDHNNLDELYKPNDTIDEVYKITRTINLDFQSTDPEFPEGALLGWGDSSNGGIYRETLGGLHKDNINVEGTFRVQKVSSISELR